MDISIFKLPSIKTPIEIIKKDIKYENNISPRLLKYGFNNIIGNLHRIKITQNDNYKVGLNFDFDNVLTKKILTNNKIFDSSFLNYTFAEFWEILTLFGLLKKETSFATSHKKDLKNVIETYKNLSQCKNKLSIVPKNPDIYINRYCDDYLDENSVVYVILKDLVQLEKLEKNGSLILQIFDVNTIIMLQLIYYLSSHFEHSYIIRPTITSNISNSKYIVLTNLKKSMTFNFDINKNVSSLFTNTLDTEFENVIKCVNFDILAKIVKTYSVISKYIEQKVYIGARYNELIEVQNNFIQSWFDTFSNLEKIQTSFDDSINNFYHKCSKFLNIENNT